MARPKTLFQKVWERHEVVAETADTPAVLYIDLHLIHEVTSPQAFTCCGARAAACAARTCTLATMDHSTPTRTEQVFGDVPITIESAAQQIRSSSRSTRRVRRRAARPARRAARHRARHRPGTRRDPAGQDDRLRRQPHEHARRLRRARLRHRHAPRSAMCSRRSACCSASRRPSRSTSRGRLQPGVTAKDLILAIIGKIGVSGGTGHVLEYRGEAIRALDDGRAHDRLQHVDRGRRARRHDRARRDDFRLPEGPAARPAGRGLGRARSHAGARSPSDAGRAFRPRRSTSMPARSNR